MIENVLCKYNLPKREARVFFALARATWGWQLKGKKMTQREIAELTCIKPGNISKTLKSMVDKCIIITRNGKLKTYFEINRDYMTWRLPERDGLFTEALKLSTGSRNKTPSEVIPRDGNFYEKDNVGDIPRDNNHDIPGDNIDWQETPSSAEFVAIAKKALKKY
ncbi:MAG: replication protein [Planctomycetes bacterium]|nr:replication protein [Planctomycetota bacterium]